jgi:2-C-methyl-D-erythritol 2,4-cyclodiphosphate synthase
MRIGIGYDVHPLAEGRDLFLGGVKIPHSTGLLGHSDGDVLIHAICDAILGALSEEDIGFHFPDFKEETKGIESGRILERVAKIMEERRFSVENIDAVIKAEEPIISPFKPLIRQNIARILKVEEGRVSIKGKRTEGLGYVGQKKAIEAYAVVLLREEKDGKGEVCAESDG